MRGKYLFVLTDGGHARLVERSRETGAFVTLEELDNGHVLRGLRQDMAATTPGRTMGSAGEHRHAVGPEDYERAAKEAFVSHVAERAGQVVRERRHDGVVLAAPPRLIGPLREALDTDILVAEVLGKDLVKAPDHELGRWLGRLPDTAAKA